MQIEANEQVFLYLTIDTSRSNLRVFERLSEATKTLGDAYLLYHARDRVPKVLDQYRHFVVTDESLAATNYPMFGASLVPFNVHFPLMRFWLDNPDYDYYWIIEDDVRFNGNWHIFFEAYAKVQADLLACHVRRFQDEPKWFFWELQHPTQMIPESDRLRSFNPISRLSNRGAQCVNDAHLAGWQGHFEMLIATMLHANGLKVADFGGYHEFSTPGFGYRFYTEAEQTEYGALQHTGTMRYRPIYHSLWGKEKNKLFHPVKLLSARYRIAVHRVTQWFQAICSEKES